MNYIMFILLCAGLVVLLFAFGVIVPRFRMERRAVRQVLILACAIATASVLGCSDAKSTNNMQSLLDKISHSPESELPGLLYGYSQSSTEAQEVLLGMLRPFRAPSSEQHMSVEAVRQSGRFTMIVARVPWPRGTEPAGLQPIIVTGDAGHEQIVGYMLPFNDILPLMQGGDMQSITELSQWWIQKYGQKRGV
jgi:hypothetical protein